MEAKQNVNLTEALGNIDNRISKTRNAIFNQSHKCKAKFVSRLAPQRGSFLYGVPKFVVAIGSQNMDQEKQEEVMKQGYLAIAPNGDDFVVKQTAFHFF